MIEQQADTLLYYVRKTEKAMGKGREGKMEE
jgi:hypothetical protein